MFKNLKVAYNQQFVNVIQPVGETFTKFSATVPGQDITVAEIYRRYGNGSLPNVQFQSIDDTDESFENTSNYFDRIEANEFAQSQYEELAKAQNEAMKAEYNEAKRKQYEALKAEFESESVSSSNADLDNKSAEL